MPQPQARLLRRGTQSHPAARAGLTESWKQLSSVPACLCALGLPPALPTSSHPRCSDCSALCTAGDVLFAVNEKLAGCPCGQGQRGQV